MLASYLANADIQLDVSHTARSGLEALAANDYEALLLDVMLPDGDGFDLCRRIRAGSTIPILMLTARGDEMDRIVGLEIGADDYLPKPFNPRELLARLRALIRRQQLLRADSGAGSVNTLRFGRLCIDPDRRAVELDGEPRELTAHQFDLLWTLARNAGRVMSRERLMSELGISLDSYDRSIDVHVSRIRQVIEDDPRRPRRLLTVRGSGYLLARRQDAD